MKATSITEKLLINLDKITAGVETPRRFCVKLKAFSIDQGRSPKSLAKNVLGLFNKKLFVESYFRNKYVSNSRLF